MLTVSLMYNVKKGGFMMKFFVSKKTLIVVTIITVIFISFFAYFEAVRGTCDNRAYTSEEIESMDIELVNINTADVKELCSISALSENQAQSIVSYREEFGEFKSIEEIKNVKLIGEKTYEIIKVMITI